MPSHVKRLPPIDHRVLDGNTANASAAEANAYTFDQPLDTLNDVETLLELQHDPRVSDIRAAMALLRSLRNDSLDEMARYQAASVDE